MLTLFIIELIFEWKDFVEGFKAGTHLYNKSK